MGGKKSNFREEQFVSWWAVERISALKMQWGCWRKNTLEQIKVEDVMICEKWHVFLQIFRSDEFHDMNVNPMTMGYYLGGD